MVVTNLAAWALASALCIRLWSLGLHQWHPSLLPIRSWPYLISHTAGGVPMVKRALEGCSLVQAVLFLTMHCTHAVAPSRCSSPL